MIEKNIYPSRGLTYSQLKRRKKLLRKIDLEFKLFRDSYAHQLIEELKLMMDKKVGGFSLVRVKDAMPDGELFIDRMCRSMWISVMLKIIKSTGYNYAVNVFSREIIDMINVLSIHEILHMEMGEDKTVVLNEEIVCHNIERSLFNWRKTKCPNIICLA